MKKFNDGTMKEGFTLVEMLTSASILVITVISVCGIFLSTVGSQRKVGQIANILQDSQFVMETLVKDIRSSEVDYTSSYYDGDGDGGISGAETELALKSSVDDLWHLYYKLNGSTIEKSTDGTNWYTVTMSTIQISSLYFLIDPQTDPFTHISTVYKQPRVTIIMTIKPASYSQDWLTLQQTIPQRFTQKK